MTTLPLTVGWEEWLALPDLKVPAIKAKVDTGARTSAIHAFSVAPYRARGRDLVRFAIHPLPERPDIEVVCSAPLVDTREVTSSNGETELRPIIETQVEIGGQRWPIEVSLTNRETMMYRMLLGRTAMLGRAVVDPERSCLQGEPDLSDLYDAPDADTGSGTLRIALLTREPHSYSSKRLVEACENRDHMIDVIDTARCSIAVNELGPHVRYDGTALPRYDGVIPRIGASITPYGAAIVRQFELTGAFTLTGSDSLVRARDKLLAHQIMARHGIGMPATGFARSPKDTRDLISSVGGAPVVVKLLKGTHGTGVVLAETYKAAESVIAAFQGLDAEILVQSFIKEAKGEDLRCFVVGGRVVASMLRKAAEGEYRANLHRGGLSAKARLTKTERDTAARAAKALGLQVAGVDMLRASDGPKVLEVNASPGLEGIEKVSKKDVAGLIVEHIEKRVRPGRRRKQ